MNSFETDPLYQHYENIATNIALESRRRVMIAPEAGGVALHAVLQQSALTQAERGITTVGNTLGDFMALSVGATALHPEVVTATYRTYAA